MNQVVFFEKNECLQMDFYQMFIYIYSWKQSKGRKKCFFQKVKITRSHHHEYTVKNVFEIIVYTEQTWSVIQV